MKCINCFAAELVTPEGVAINSPAKGDEARCPNCPGMEFVRSGNTWGVRHKPAPEAEGIMALVDRRTKERLEAAAPPPKPLDDGPFFF